MSNCQPLLDACCFCGDGEVQTNIGGGYSDEVCDLGNQLRPNPPCAHVDYWSGVDDLIADGLDPSDPDAQCTPWPEWVAEQYQIWPASHCSGDSRLLQQAVAAGTFDATDPTDDDEVWYPTQEEWEMALLRDQHGRAVHPRDASGIVFEGLGGVNFDGSGLTDCIAVDVRYYEGLNRQAECQADCGGWSFFFYKYFSENKEKKRKFIQVISSRLLVSIFCNHRGHSGILV